jgi:hypothetical protein
MKIRFRFRIPYLILAILIFAIETMIALFVNDRIIRPYVGDVLVVILIYCFIQAFFEIPVLVAGFSVLVFAFLVEISQYFHLVEILRLQHFKLALVVMGNSFQWIDFIAYTLGIGIVFGLEKTVSRRASPNRQ